MSKTFSRYIAPQPTIPTNIHSTRTLSATETQSLLSDYLSTTTSQPLWSHTHDAATTAALRRIEMSLRGIQGHDAVLLDDISAITNTEGAGGRGEDGDKIVKAAMEGSGIVGGEGRVGYGSMPAGQDDGRITYVENGEGEDEEEDLAAYEVADVNAADGEEGGDDGAMVADMGMDDSAVDVRRNEAREVMDGDAMRKPEVTIDKEMRKKLKKERIKADRRQKAQAMEMDRS